MFDCQLFLLLPLGDDHISQLNRLHPGVRSSFIREYDTELYLRQIAYKGVTYIGKNLGDLIDMEALRGMQCHLLSVLQRLLPEASCSREDLLLLAISEAVSEQVGFLHD